MNTWPEPKETELNQSCWQSECAKTVIVDKSDGWWPGQSVVVVDAEMWAAVLEALAVGVVAVDNAGYHVPYQAIRDLLERLPDGVREKLEGGGDARD